MKQISDRISYEKSEEKTHIEIITDMDKSKQNGLLAWMILWTVTCVFIVYQFFWNSSGTEKIFYFVWFAFWCYYEYKVVLAFRWHQWGKEVIEIDDENITVYKEIARRGLPKYYPIDEVEDIRKIESERTFSRVFGQSYWSISGETIAFTYGKRDVIFGTNINQHELKELLKFVRYQYKFYLNNNRES